MRFSDWVQLRELAPPIPGANPNNPADMSPATKMAQNSVADALKKMPMRPGEDPLKILQDPKRQKDLLAQTTKQASQQGKIVNLGAAAQALDPVAAATGV